ncbi:LysR family transcriptional regulator [Moritella sp. 5]|uniref:LysR family transcriptional regulator n=1 Tax=Moritella sp. 5 TaxID=2746231 RepID=UPI001BA66FEF|nr:LysR family transcriptional regulator [Moritella sp. 5]QUM80400.1 LysR family transcriptional regulator [Moritella sp. 5]
MKIEDLKLVDMIVKQGSFTKAACALDLPRSNVSRRILKLEEQLGFPLFYRTTRSLSLTNYGKAYYEQILVVLEALEKANHLTQTIAEHPKGLVKIGILSETDELLTPLIFAFSNKYPDVEIDIRTINNGFIDIYQQDLDIAFHAGSIIDSNLVAKQVVDVKRILVASPDYINRHDTPRNIEQLKQHQCIHYRWSNGMVDTSWLLSGEQVDVSGNLSSNSLGVLKQAVLHGQGIAFLPQILLSKELQEGRLINILPEYYSAVDKGWLLYPETRAISHATRLLIDHLSEEVHKLPFSS